MTDKPIEVFRLILTIIGFILFAVFGMRAAEQASSMKLAGATNRNNIWTVNVADTLNPLTKSDVLKDISFTASAEAVSTQPQQQESSMASGQDTTPPPTRTVEQNNATPTEKQTSHKSLPSSASSVAKQKGHDSPMHHSKKIHPTRPQR